MRFQYFYKIKEVNTYFVLRCAAFNILFLFVVKHISMGKSISSDADAQGGKRKKEYKPS